MFKKFKTLFIVVIISILSLTGCGANNPASNNSTNGKEVEANKTPLTKDEFVQLYSDSSKFKNRSVDFYAKIFMAPEKDDKGTYMQAYANNDNSKNTIIRIADPKLDVKDEDIIHVVGTVGKAFEGKNGFGADLNLPSIDASKIEKADYATAFAPSIKTIQIDKEINQHGYVLKLNKVEVAEKETRLYININNTTKEKVTFYSFNTNIIQDSKQFKELSNYDEVVPEIDSDILPGVIQDGVLIFDPVQADGENLKIMFEGRSDNYELEFKPFSFEAILK